MRCRKRSIKLTSLTFHGGVGEIGGNKVLLEDGDARLLLDFGMSFNQSGLYFSEFLQPRRLNSLGDFLVTGLLPDLEGVYREDYLAHMGRPREERAVDGVLVSHAHMDHCAYLHHLRGDIPVYMSPETLAIVRTLEETGSGSFSDLTRYRENFAVRPKKRGEGYTRVKGKEATSPRPVETFQLEKSFEVAGIEVKPFIVDHSLPGATAYLIHASEGSVLYTGDFRFHGYRGEETARMVEEVAGEGVDAVVTEGTRVDEAGGTTEADVLETAAGAIAGARGLAVVNFPPRDLDRLVTFLEVARRTGRRLALTTKQAYLLERLGEVGDGCPSLDDESVCVYVERKGWGLVGRDDYPPGMVEQDYYIWERKYIDQDNTVNYLDVRDNQGEYMLYCSQFQINELIDVEPRPGSVYVKSVTEPFDDEMRLDHDRIMNWLRLFDLELIGMNPDHPIHASGHASGPEIFQMLETINPGKIYPIHTEHPELFAERFDQTQIVEKGVTYTL